MANQDKPDKYIYIKFILIFSISFSMIVWTIVQTSKAGVGLDDDNAFLSTYQDVDANFNNIVKQNNEFERNYNVKFMFNDQEIIGLTYKDVFLAQRAIELRDIRKNMLKVGKNSFKVFVQDKQGNNIDQKKVTMLVTKAVTHEFDENVELLNQNQKEFNVANAGYWNITGSIEVNGKKGFFYIKTDAKK